MRNFLVGLCALCVVGLGASSVCAQTAEASPAHEEHAPEAGGKRAREFQGDDIGQVLRLLARQAKINLAVGEAVKGNVSLRLENASAMDAIEVLVHQYKLTLTKDKDVYYVDVPGPATATLELIAKPETAEQIAAYQRRLYEALLKEGFASNDALQLTAAGSGNLLLSLTAKQNSAPEK